MHLVLCCEILWAHMHFGTSEYNQVPIRVDGSLSVDCNGNWIIPKKMRNKMLCASGQRFLACRSLSGFIQGRGETKETFTHFLKIGIAYFFSVTPSLCPYDSAYTVLSMCISIGDLAVRLLPTSWMQWMTSQDSSCSLGNLKYLCGAGKIWLLACGCMFFHTESLEDKNRFRLVPFKQRLVVWPCILARSNFLTLWIKWTFQCKNAYNFSACHWKPTI